MLPLFVSLFGHFYSKHWADRVFVYDSVAKFA